MKKYVMFYFRAEKHHFCAFLVLNSVNNFKVRSSSFFTLMSLPYTFQDLNFSVVALKTKVLFDFWVKNHLCV